MWIYSLIVNSPTRPYEEQGNVLYSEDEQDMDKIAVKCIRSYLKPIKRLTYPWTCP